jgi:hypothetical protein
MANGIIISFGVDLNNSPGDIYSVTKKQPGDAESPAAL